VVGAVSGVATYGKLVRLPGLVMMLLGFLEPLLGFGMRSACPQQGRELVHRDPMAVLGGLPEP
jgi:hypothetical protein